MNRRVIAAIIAAVLALGGLGLIASYVRSADERALAGVEAVSVYVVEVPIAKGVAAADLGASVAKRSLPAAAVPADAVKSLDTISGRVLNADLVKGEILLGSRFVDREVLSQQTVKIPDGYQTVSFLLRPEQVVGGILQPGNHIGVIFSSKITTSQQQNGALPAGSTIQVEGQSVGIESDVMSKMVLQQVLVTRVQGAVVPASSTSDTTDKKANAAPSDGEIGRAHV